MISVPLEPPKLTIKPLSSTILKLNWTKLKPEIARGIIVGYRVQWRRSKIDSYYNVQEVSEYLSDL